MSTKVEAWLRAGPEAAALARQRLDTLSGQIEAELQENLRLLVSELVTNSVRHAGLRRDASIRLRIELQPECVHVSVTDAGPGFSPRAVRPEAGAEGGWGLFLVEQISDRWGVGRGEDTSVWFEIDRERASA